MRKWQAKVFPSVIFFIGIDPAVPAAKAILASPPAESIP